MPQANHPTPAPTDPAQPIHVAPGVRFTVVLAANRTTGFSWQLVSQPHPHAVQQGNTEYQEAPHQPGMTGVGGWEIWTFHALTPGHTTLTFHYRQPFNPHAAPAEVTTFTVIIA